MIVKDEVDIVHTWVHHHASLFGYESLFVIDNNSTDGTYEVLQQLSRRYGIRVSRDSSSFKAKAALMTSLIRAQAAHYTLVLPIDVDEYLVACDKRAMAVTAVCAHLDALPLNYSSYKLATLWPRITVDGGYATAPLDAQLASFEIGQFTKWQMGKTFFSTAAGPIPTLDRGFHMERLAYRSYFTMLCLAHYHTRNAEQLSRKTVNAWRGYGYPMQLAAVERMPQYNFPGQHYRPTILDILRGKNLSDAVATRVNPRYDVVSLAPLQDHLAGSPPRPAQKDAAGRPFPPWRWSGRRWDGARRNLSGQCTWAARSTLQCEPTFRCPFEHPSRGQQC